MINLAKQTGSEMDFRDVSACAVAPPLNVEHAKSAGSEQDEERRDRIFRQRAEKLVTRQKFRRDTAVRVPVLVVAVKNEKYGIELRHVKHVFRSVECTAVPGAGRELVGVADLSGDICSVLDLSALLNIALRDPGAHGLVVQVMLNGIPVGVRVDEVREVRQMAFDALVTFDELGAAPATKYVRGISTDGVAVLNMEALTAHGVFLTT